MPDGSVRARVISLSRTEDVALLKLDAPPPKGVIAATLGDSDALKVGDFVGCIGAPFGLRDSFSTGVVSQLRDDYGDEFSLGPKRVIQTDAAINHGNSGGALFNAYGEVVGIASSIRTTARDAGSVGIGFAVPSATVKKRLFDQPLPAVGVLLRRIPEPVGRALHWDVPGGALLVERVVPGGPADKAGLRGGYVPADLAGYQVVLGGDIIVKVGPHPTSEPDKVAEYLRNLKAGETLSYTMVRESHKGQVDIVVPASPKPPALKVAPKHTR
jgi:S1-C subfamily serine protease